MKYFVVIFVASMAFQAYSLDEQTHHVTLSCLIRPGSERGPAGVPGNRGSKGDPGNMGETIFNFMIRD